MRTIVGCLVLTACATTVWAQAPSSRALERDILRQLIEINTSDSAKGTPAAAKAMARRLLDAGFPAADVRVLGYSPEYQNLVARFRGSGARRPILLMAHLDVVDARKEDWSVDPYAFLERDGWYYGRGTSDNKAGAAILIANFIRWRKEGFTPDRDLIVALTADEETSSESITWLLAEHRDLVDAAFALNTDAGGGSLVGGQPVSFAVQASEKVYLSFQLEVRNAGGHSSVPIRDNAITHLAEGLTRLAAFEFPIELNEISRAFFERSAATAPARQAADMRAVAARSDLEAAGRLGRSVPYFNAVVRTTCIATRLFAGHADNALPQIARATVNCRILPGKDPAEVEGTVHRVLADTAIKVTRVAEPTASPPSPLAPDLVQPIEALVREMWPGAVVIPEMSTGATDGLYVRNAGIPVYGVAAIFDDPTDIRAHGRDERVGVKAFHDAAEFWYRLVRRLATRERTD